MSEMKRVEQEVADFIRTNSGSDRYYRRFPIGNGHYVQIHITQIAGSAIDANAPVQPETIDFAVQFYSGSDNWFRVDNQGNANFLHSHLHSGSRKLCDHVPLSGSFTILQLIGECFTQARQVKGWKFP